MLLAAALAGCGPGNGLTLGRVQGKVTYKGEPVKYGTVSFVPDAQGDRRPDRDRDHQGRRHLYPVHRRCRRRRRGRPSKVSVVGLDPTPVTEADEKPCPPREVAPGVHEVQGQGHPQRASPRSESGRGAARSDTFTDRGGRTYRYVVPKKLGVPEESGLEVDVARGSNTINIEVAEDGTARIGK